jgi:DNA-binding response OmpR family regulator
VLNDSKDEAAMQILLVDDNALQASTREAILARNGMRVIVADGPQAALDILSEAAGRSSIHLMVTDHLMPGMNGAELSRKVRVLAPDMPILVLSGMPDAEMEYAGMDILFQLKPFPPPEFIRLVRSLLGQRSLRSA